MKFDRFLVPKVYNIYTYTRHTYIGKKVSFVEYSPSAEKKLVR